MSAVSMPKHQTPSKAGTSLTTSSRRGVELLAAVVIAELPGVLDRWPDLAKLVPSEEEATTTIRLTTPADTLMAEMAEEASGALVQITRPRPSDGIMHALQRLDTEKPPELKPGSLAGKPGGESPATQTVKRTLPRWAKEHLEELRSAAELAWGRAPSESMVVQYVITRLKVGEKRPHAREPPARKSSGSRA